MKYIFILANIVHIYEISQNIIKKITSSEKENEVLCFTTKEQNMYIDIYLKSASQTLLEATIAWNRTIELCGQMP